MNELKIVKADYNNNDDRAAIPFLLNEYTKSLLGYNKPMDKEVLDKLVDGLKKFSGSLVLLAKFKKEYAGMAICFFGFSTFSAKKIINIHDFMVLDKFQGKGIAKKLLKAIDQEGLDNNCSKITLEVQENNNRARSLYGSHGFQGSFLDDEAGGQLFLTKEL